MHGHVGAVLSSLAAEQLTVAQFLDALLWGDKSCITDTTAKSAQFDFCQSPELLGILDHLYTPPRTSTGTRAIGASGRVQKWALACVKASLIEDLENFSTTLKLKSASDVSAEHDFLSRMVVDLPRLAPSLEEILRTLAKSEHQIEKGTEKDPSKVCYYTFPSNNSY